MPGAGTDKTKELDRDRRAGRCSGRAPARREHRRGGARHGEFRALARLRLVKPRDGWPNIHAQRSASGADRILDDAMLFDRSPAAIADCTLVLATTARAHDQAKPVLGPGEAAPLLAPHVAAGENVAVLFGRERYGLENHEVALADRIVTLPVNPAFASLNLAQAVALIAYEWFKLASGGALPFAMPQKSEPAAQATGAGILRQSRARARCRSNIFRPLDKRATMLINLRNIFARMQPTQQDIQTLHGDRHGAAGRPQGPGARRRARWRGSRGRCARCWPNTAGARVPGERGPVRGLARLLRRNPTDAERMLWDALTKDRRFAGHGFKRQVPVGPHITDFVSFPLRVVIDVVPARGERGARPRRAPTGAPGWPSAAIGCLQSTRATIEADVAQVLDGLAAAIARQS